MTKRDRKHEEDCSCVIAFAIAAPSLAMAQNVSLKVREARAKWEGRAQGEWLVLPEQRCDKDFSASIDWTHFPTDDSFFANETRMNSCQAAFSALERVCTNSPLGKQAIQERITGITCHFGAFEDTQITSDGVFHAYFDWSATNLTTQYRGFLGDNL